MSKFAVCDKHGTIGRCPKFGSPPACPGCHHDMLKRVLAGEKLQAVGDDYNLTRERIRQIVTALDPQATALGMAVRQEASRIQAEVDHAKRLATYPPCFICHGPITQMRRGPHGAKRRTCSPRCSELRDTVKYHLGGREVQRRAQARYHLAHPDQVTNTQLRHAARVLAGTARHYNNPAGPVSPKIAAALDEVERLRAQNPDLLAEGRVAS